MSWLFGNGDPPPEPWMDNKPAEVVEVEFVGGGPADGETREVGRDDTWFAPLSGGMYRIDHAAGVARYVPPEVAP